MEHNIKAKAIISSLLVLFATLTACTDLEPLTTKVDSMESRLASLENTCKTLNSNISSLQEIAKAVQGCDYVTDVTPIVKNGQTVGYTVKFAKGQPISVYHGTDGKNGKDGISPIISVNKDNNGLLCWTVNGEWMLDGSGHKVAAVGKDGATPKFRIDNGYWEISYDNGSSWAQCGKSTFTDDSFFKDIIVDKENVKFILTDGTDFIIPRNNPLDITFQAADLAVMQNNSTRDIHYSIKTASDEPTIEIISSGDIKAKLTKTDAKTGLITVKTGSLVDKFCKVMILVTDGNTLIMRTLMFQDKGIIVADGSN